ncbi:MAG: hypothetical protein HKP56_17950 [Anderseniella sp.]|nr:hypothetical protein [Anderseniella sp.]
MSYVVMSFAKRCGSTSLALQWPRRLFVGLAMVLLLPVSQSAAATPFCGVELNFTSVDFSDQGSQGSSVDAPNKMARLKSDDGAFGAKNSSNAKLGFLFTPQPPGPAKTILSGILVAGKIRGIGNVNEEQVGH